VILARPTLSLALHIQQLGRGLRPFEGKGDCLVLDHAANVARHGRVEEFVPPALDTLDKHSDRRKRTDPVREMRPCSECGAALDPGQFECTECGHLARRPNRVDFIEGELIEAPEAVARIEYDAEAIQRAYREFAWVAAERNYKTGWCYMKTLDRFGLANAPKAMVKRLVPYSLRDAAPLPPSGATMRWLKSQQIAWAKSRGRA
jgi:superfamily II DNA or RNA helicase